MTERGKHVGAEKIMYSMKRQHKCKKKKKEEEGTSSVMDG